MKTPRIYYGALAAFCVVALCIGFASAAGSAQATYNSTHGTGTGHQALDLTNATVQQQIISQYEHQGVDVTALKAAFQSGDTAAAKSLISVHRPVRPESGNKSLSKGFDLTNTTLQQEILARYTKQGIDTTGLTAAFQSGNATDVKTWMSAHRPAAPGFAKGTFGKTPDYTNATIQQEILARYTKQSVDTTGLTAAFHSGNVTDVKIWMSAHRPAAPGFVKGTFGKTPDYTNATVKQQILTRLDNQGVDTSALKVAFQNGDTAAVKSWFEANMKAHSLTNQSQNRKSHSSS
jgi:hypothetical protein